MESKYPVTIGKGRQTDRGEGAEGFERTKKKNG